MKTLTTAMASGVVAAAAACAVAPHALAQSEGGLYIADAGFSFEQASNRALARNPKGQRFFVLALPPNTDALTRSAPKASAAVRERVIEAGGVLLVCQRDLDSRAVDASKLLPGVVAVRGFPPPGSKSPAAEERYFPGENPDTLPRSNEALRRLRATCS